MPEKKRYDHPWNTERELDFLEKLGTWAQSVVSIRKKLLKNYSESIKGRRWDDNIDVQQVEDYLNKEGT